MTHLTVAMRYLEGRAVASVLTAVSIALGVALVIATSLLSRGIKQSFVEGTTDYGLVVGAKGSPTQLVLNVVFRLASPTPNILFGTYETLRDAARVDVAVPVAMGDAFHGFRYVATTRDYFAAFPWRRKTFTVATGRLFRDDALDDPGYEAVVGADAARVAGLKVGDRFYEGEEMAEYPLTVVGILRATRSPDDAAIFFSLPSYWAMNEIARKMPQKPLTAVLVRAKKMSDLPALHRELNVSADTQAVFPSAILLTIFNLLGLADQVLRIVLAIVAVVVLLYVFLSMWSATLARRREIATMRALGASRVTILMLVLLESCAISFIGGAVGVVVGHAVAYVGAHLLAGRGFVTDPFAIGALQPAVFAGVVLLGGAAALVPAVLAYRTDVAEHLAPLS